MPWRVLSGGATVLTGGSLAFYRQSALAEALAAACTITLLVVGLTLIAVIIWGGDQQREHVFRLLRWIRGCPEPPYFSDHRESAVTGEQEVSVRR